MRVRSTANDDTNYDESKVPAYTLPDPLVHDDGTPVRDADGWRARRAELLALFGREMYGATPTATVPMDVALLSEDKDALHGAAARRELTVTFANNAHTMTVLVFLPNTATAPVPLFLGLNFHGNHTVHPDRAIALPDVWVPDNPARNHTGHGAREEDRGVNAQHWPVERIVERGYGLATVYCGDIDPDWDDGFENGVHALFPDVEAGAWGTVGAWAWGLSRALDACLTQPEIDNGRVAVMGHSRLGKAALWAAAQDERFALAVSNNSGSCGAALARRRFGETVAHINSRFPHWFCRAFHAYNDREDALPFDQHALLALIAPRPLYVASAAADLWADPRGEFLSALQASAVYRLLGTDGLAADEMPPVEHPITSRVAYHLRSGLHDVTAYDWEQFLLFADRTMP